MSLNRLIAMGGTQNVSPVQRYQQSMRDIEVSKANRLSMLNTQQQMELNRNVDTRASQQMELNQQKLVAAEGKAKQKAGIDYMASIENPMRDLQRQDPSVRAQHYKEVTLPVMQQQAQLQGVEYELPQDYDETSLNQSMAMYDAQEWKNKAPVYKEEHAGVNERGQNLITQIKYEGGNEVGRSQPYVKNEAQRTMQVESSDYETKSNRDKSKRASEESEIGIHKSVNTLNKLSTLFDDPAFVGGITGNAIQGINSAVQQATQAMGLLSLESSDYKLPDEDFDSKDGSENYNALRESAMAGSRSDAMIIELTYQLAKEGGQKVTDKDFAFTKKMLTAGADTRINKQLISDMKGRLVENYNAQGLIKQQRRPNSTFNPYTDERHGQLYPGSSQSPASSPASSSRSNALQSIRDQIKATQ